MTSHRSNLPRPHGTSIKAWMSDVDAPGHAGPTTEDVASEMVGPSDVAPRIVGAPVPVAKKWIKDNPARAQALLDAGETRKSVVAAAKKILADA